MSQGAGPSNASARPRRVPSGIAPHPELLFDGTLKFAFEVFEMVGQLSGNQLRLASQARPSFHPGCTELMTPEMRTLFQNEWSIAEEVKLIYLVMNTPRVHNRNEFARLLGQVLRSYRRKGFTRKLFVEFVFLLAYWTLVLRQRNEWVGGTDYALDLITVFTRYVLENGGFDGCQQWPMTLNVQGVDLVIPADDD